MNSRAPRWAAPDSDDDHIGGFDAAVAPHDLLGLAGAAQLIDPDAEPKVDAVVGVQPTEDRTDLVAGNALQWDRCGVDEHDLGAHLSGGGGHIGPDPARPDHGDPRGRSNGLAQLQGVLQRAPAAPNGTALSPAS